LAPGPKTPGSLSELGERLRARRSEIEQATLTRAYAISDPARIDDTAYLSGLRAAVSAAISHGIEGIERGGRRVPPPPAALLTQARVAARAGVGLDTVLRRYLAGYALLRDFLIEEAEAGSIEGAELKRALALQSTLFDRLLAAISEEHGREASSRPSSAEGRRKEQVERLLAGELLDASELGYELGGSHTAAIASGPGAPEALRDLARALGRRLLLVEREQGVHWAWLGARAPLRPEEIERATAAWPSQIAAAIGESGSGLAGWRLTHRQAAAALPLALREPGRALRYADVALSASILRDDLLSTSLRELYLAPLEAERDRGQRLRETLRAYFAAERNVSSAAAALGVDRHTVANRLRAAEERVGRPLASCVGDLEAALRLEELGYLSRPGSAPTTRPGSAPSPRPLSERRFPPLR